MKEESYVDFAGEVTKIANTYYEEWQEKEGIPIVKGYFVVDINTLPLAPWERKGGLGTFINLAGAEFANDCYICEIPPGASLKPQRHLFEEWIYVIKGMGATSIWNEGGAKQSFEWQEGSLFSPPLNAWHQHFNTGSYPARYIALRRGSENLLKDKYKSTLSISKGGDGIDYADEDPEIRRMFLEELAKEGVECTMPPV